MGGETGAGGGGVAKIRVLMSGGVGVGAGQPVDALRR